MTDIPPAARGPLVALIAALRPDWGKPGVTKALEKLNSEPGLTTERRVMYAIRAALNPELKTPEGMNLPGPHRTGTLPEETRTPESRCHHDQPNSTCQQCRNPRRLPPDQHHAWAEKVRAQLRERKQS